MNPSKHSWVLIKYPENGKHYRCDGCGSAVISPSDAPKDGVNGYIFVTYSVAYFTTDIPNDCDEAMCSRTLDS